MKTCKKLFAAGAAFGLIASCSVAQETRDTAPMVTAKKPEMSYIESDFAWMDQASEIIFENEQIPASVTAIIHRGKIVHVIAHGELKRGSGVVVDSDTFFQTASIAKMMTGIIAQNLINEGKLEPDAPLASYLPDSLSPQAKRKLSVMTVQDLLHHRAGFPRDSQVATRAGNDPLLTPLTEVGLLEDLEKLEPVGAPGELFEYSNLGFGTVGYILERASDQPYDQLLKTYVTGPYAMNETSIALPVSKHPRLAMPYRKENRFVQTQPWQAGKLSPASAFYSTVNDLSNLMIAQIKSYRDHDKSGVNSALITTLNPTQIREDMAYGYGMWISPLTYEGRSYPVYAHNGDMDGYAGGYLFVPDLDFGIVTLTSSGGRWQEIHQNLLLRKLAGREVDLPERQ